MWADFLDPSRPDGYDVLICPVFATAAFPHDRSAAFQPFWRETGRTLAVDGEATPYQRHVFWSALTGTCFLPSTAFPAGCGAESELPIGLQVVGREGADFITIHCPGHPGRLSGLRVFHSKSVLYGAFCMGAQGA